MGGQDDHQVQGRRCRQERAADPPRVRGDRAEAQGPLAGVQLRPDLARLDQQLAALAKGCPATQSVHHAAPGGAMDSFDLLFSLFSLLIGLAMAEILGDLGRVIDHRKTLRIGWLTPMLALFVLLDLASFWQGLYGYRSLLH